MFEWITEIDHGILLFIQEYLRLDWLTPFVKFISSLGNAGFFWILLSVGFLCFKKTRKAGVLSLLSLLLCFLVTNVALKNIVARMRPYHRYEDILLLIAHPGDFSFPSGHSASAFAAAGVLFHYVDKRVGIGLLILASAIAAFTAVFRGALSHRCSGRGLCGTDLQFDCTGIGAAVCKQVFTEKKLE